MSDSPVIILTGGDPPTDPGSALLRSAFVIAADSGLDAADRLGLDVDLVVGDFDSALPSQVTAARAAGAAVEAHPADKDATDLELALEAALERGLQPALLLGGASFDRIDHFMANALLLAMPRFAPLRPRWLVKGAEVVPVHDVGEIRGDPGDVVTLLPVGGTATGVDTTGLRWALTDDDLDPGTTRGVSNEMTAELATVSVTGGTLLTLHIRSSS